MLREELWNAIVKQFPNWKEQLDGDVAETVYYYFNNVIPSVNIARAQAMLQCYKDINDWLDDLTMSNGLHTFHKPVLVNWNDIPVLCFNVKTYLMCYRGWYYALSETIQGTKLICEPSERLDGLLIASSNLDWRLFVNALSIINVLGKYTTSQLHNFLNFSNPDTVDALNQFFMQVCRDDRKDFNFWYATLFKQYKSQKPPRFSSERTFVINTENGSILATVSKEAIAVSNYIGDTYYTTQIDLPSFVWNIYFDMHEMTAEWFVSTCLKALCGLHGVNTNFNKMVCTVPCSFIDDHECSTFNEAVKYLQDLMNNMMRA